MAPVSSAGETGRARVEGVVSKMKDAWYDTGRVSSVAVANGCDPVAGREYARSLEVDY